MRHGAQTSILNNDRSLDMLVITLQKMAVKAGQIHLFRKLNVGSIVLSPLDREDFLLVNTNTRWYTESGNGPPLSIS